VHLLICLVIFRAEVIFSSEELAYDDYVLKRNIAIATGKADIIIDCFYKENHGIGLKNITKVLQKYNGYM